MLKSLEWWEVCDMSDCRFVGVFCVGSAPYKPRKTLVSIDQLHTRLSPTENGRLAALRLLRSYNPPDYVAEVGVRYSAETFEVYSDEEGRQLRKEGV